MYSAILKPAGCNTKPIPDDIISHCKYDILRTKTSVGVLIEAPSGCKEKYVGCTRDGSYSILTAKDAFPSLLKKCTAIVPTKPPVGGSGGRWNTNGPGVNRPVCSIVEQVLGCPPSGIGFPNGSRKKRMIV